MQRLRARLGGVVAYPKTKHISMYYIEKVTAERLAEEGEKEQLRVLTEAVTPLLEQAIKDLRFRRFTSKQVQKLQRVLVQLNKEIDG